MEKIPSVTCFSSLLSARNAKKRIDTFMIHYYQSCTSQGLTFWRLPNRLQSPRITMFGKNSASMVWAPRASETVAEYGGLSDSLRHKTEKIILWNCILVRSCSLGVIRRKNGNACKKSGRLTRWEYLGDMLLWRIAIDSHCGYDFPPVNRTHVNRMYKFRHVHYI